MYSTPSGQAVAISTNEPNSTATPSEINNRDRPSGPPDPDSGVAVSPVDVVAAGVTVEPVAGVDPTAGVVAAGTSGATVSLATTNEKVELPPPLAIGLADQPRDDALALRQRIRDRHGQRDAIEPDLWRADGDRRAVADDLDGVRGAERAGKREQQRGRRGVDRATGCRRRRDQRVVDCIRVWDGERAHGSDADEHDESATNGACGWRDPIHAGGSTLEDGRERPTPPPTRTSTDRPDPR